MQICMNKSFYLFLRECGCFLNLALKFWGEFCVQEVRIDPFGLHLSAVFERPVRLSLRNILVRLD